MTFPFRDRGPQLNLSLQILAKLIAKYIKKKTKFSKTTKKIKTIGRKTEGNCRLLKEAVYVCST